MLSKKYFLSMGYSQPKQLEDGWWVAFVPLMFTTGLCMGLDETGWKKRYCFEDKEKAQEEYNKLKFSYQVPQGWIARRPKSELKHQPDMVECLSCYHKDRDCGQLNFEFMSPHLGAYEADGEIVMIVKCSEFISCGEVP